MTSKCPVCQAVLEFPEDENFELGDTVDCPECDDELECVSVDPLTFEGLAYEGESDDDENDDELDEEDDAEEDDEEYY